jgi:hypothetical protein
VTNTQMNLGIRRNFGTLGDRNFENDGTTQYKATKAAVHFLGTLYHKGDTLSYDVAGTSYSKQAIREMELLWNNEWIEPLA